MSGTPGILDSIDGALRDFETSRDAMRWVPEGAREPRPRPPAGARWIDLRGSTIVLDRGPAPGGKRPLLAPGALSGSISGPLYPGAGDALAEFGRTTAEAFRPLLDWASKMVHDFHRLFFPSQHRRCVTCHPEKKPKPLAVDGREYRRRQLARARRKRRGR